MGLSSSARDTALTGVLGVIIIAATPVWAARPEVVVSTDATQNMACSAGVCTPTAKRAVLNVTQLTNMLTDENVTVRTSAKAPDIRIKAPFSWTSARGLTLQAIGTIMVSNTVSDAGTGALTLLYNAPGGGALSFGRRGNISFLGTSNPLTINDKSYILAADVQSLAQLIARDPSGHFALARSYDAGPDGRYTHSPIPTRFKGNFEGLGNIISNLQAECAGCGGPLGFFQNTAQTAVLENVKLASVTFGGTTYTGGLVGDNQGALVQVSVQGDLSVDSTKHCVAAGGIAGLNTGTIAASQSSGTVASTKQNAHACFKLGGIAGVNAGQGWIHDSQSSAAISVHSGNDGSAAAGGAVGASSATIERTSASGNVTANGVGVLGGLVGEIAPGGTVSKSLATGSVSETNATGNGVLGGLIGSIASGTVDSSVALGSVSGGEYCECGGAIGAASTYSDEPSARVTNTVSYGAVKAALSDEVGGFIGYDGTGNDGNNGLLASDRWDMTTSGINDPSQGAGNIPNDPGITGFN